MSRAENAAWEEVGMQGPATSEGARQGGAVPQGDYILEVEGVRQPVEHLREMVLSLCGSGPHPLEVSAALTLIRRRLP